MAANLGFVAHSTKRHTHEVSACCSGHGFAQRCLTDTGRPHKAEDRPLHLANTGLDSEIFKNPLFDLLQPVMVRIQDLFGRLDIFLHARALAPRNTQYPVEIIAHDRGFSRHRAHGLQLFKLLGRLFLGFLRQLRALDPFFEFTGFITTIFGLAQFLLDRLQLFVQIVLALRLLHLPLHAVPDTLFNLQNANFGFHEGIRTLETVRGGNEFQQFLLFGDLERKVRRDRVRQFARIFNLIERNKYFRRNFLVQLDVLLELRDNRTAEGFEVLAVIDGIVEKFCFSLEEIIVLCVAHDFRALAALDEHLHGSIGEFQQLQHRTDGAHLVYIFDSRIVLSGIFLSHKQDLLVILHDIFKRFYGLIPADKERHNHVREHNNVPQGKDRKNRCFGGIRHIFSFLATLLRQALNSAPRLLLRWLALA